MRWLELFAGAGGASLGIRAAGGEAVACVEYDADACATLAAAGFPAVCADVRDWTKAIQMRQEFSRGSDVRVIDVEGMWASFPCQCWSNAGKRLGALDPRNGWPWTVAAIDAVSPEWFVAENVTGLAMHPEKHCGNVDLCPGCYFGGVILPQLRERFAWVRVWRLDAADFGVPQHRRRLFMVAGPHAARPPKPTHADPRKCLGLFATLKPWNTFSEALGLRGIVGTGQYTDVKGGGRGPHEVSTERPSPTVRVGGPRGGAVMYVDRPSVTVTTTDGTGLGSSASRDTVEMATGRRRLTKPECAKLQGFPPDHPWQGNSTAIYRQIGNAVPPALAAAVVRSLMAARE